MINNNFSTTKNITTVKPNLSKTDNEKIDFCIFLPKNNQRQSEGGLRTQGYFKNSVDNKPLITVITVVFNGEEFLEETILSVINQTYDNVEYIIIDGGSTDDTLDVIKKYEHAIDYWVSEPDKGIYDAMNKGIDLASGEWINFMNADDLLFDIGVLERLSYFFSDNYSVIFGNINYCDRSVNSSLSIKTLLHNTIHHQSALYASRLFRRFRYKDVYDIAADYELNLILYLNRDEYKHKYVNTYVALCGDKGVSIENHFKSFCEISAIKYKHLCLLSYIFIHTISVSKYMLGRVLRYIHIL